MSGKNLSSLTGECNSLAESPCIGWCTTRQFGDKRCKGCGRYDFECDTVYWSSLSDVNKKLVNLRNAAEGFTIKQLKKIGWRPTPKSQTTKPNRDNPTVQY